MCVPLMKRFSNARLVELEKRQADPVAVVIPTGGRGMKSIMRRAVKTLCGDVSVLNALSVSLAIVVAFLLQVVSQLRCCHQQPTSVRAPLVLKQMAIKIAAAASNRSEVDN